MSNPKCAACGLPGHRFGRNEGVDRYDPMACINQLRGRLELLANGVEPDYEAAAEERLRQDQAIFEDRPFDWDPDTRAIVDAAIGGRLLVDPPKEEADDG